MSEIHYATGRRKTSSARVYLSKGKGDITVNSKPLNEYFGRQVAQMLVMQPLKLTELDEKVNIKVMVKGGGSFGQAGAIRHGISRYAMPDCTCLTKTTAALNHNFDVNFFI